MKLCWPDYEAVKSYSTFELLRAKVLLPEPELPHQFEIVELVNELLAEQDPEHLAIVESAVGFGPG